MDKQDQAAALNGSDPHYTEAGSGNAVFVLQASPARLPHDGLVERFRIVTFESRDSRAVGRLAKELDMAAQQLGISKYSLIADSEFALAAIAHTIRSPRSVEALILITPSSDLGDLPLEQIEAPTLVLFGTRDRVAPPETGRLYARRIPKCFLTLVYDAGHHIGTDRPEALYVLLRDFLEHREKFVVPHDSSIINF
jgi:pimeloyl-ACP methyl ester carboxylesterase